MSDFNITILNARKEAIAERKAQIRKEEREEKEIEFLWYLAESENCIHE